jgi:hypothetical protein
MDNNSSQAGSANSGVASAGSTAAVNSDQGQTPVTTASSSASPLGSNFSASNANQSNAGAATSGGATNIPTSGTQPTTNMTPTSQPESTAMSNSTTSAMPTGSAADTSTSQGGSSFPSSSESQPTPTTGSDTTQPSSTSAPMTPPSTTSAGTANTETERSQATGFPNMPSSYATSGATSTPGENDAGNNQQSAQAVISESGGNKPSGPVTTQGKGGGSSKFKFYVIIAVVIILAIWGYVAYLYFGNQNISLKIPTDAINNIVNNSKQPDTPVESPTPTAEPTLSYMTENTTIENGSVVTTDDSGKSTILVDKKSYPGTGITGFARVVSSPAGNKICFESLPPAPEPALYYANADGSDVTEVNPNRKNCNWVSENELVYVNIANEGTPTDIYTYNIQSGLEENLTAEYSTETNVRTYKIVSVSSDGKTLSCDYSETETETGGTSVGKCEIDLTTGTVTNTEGV